jgi:hypothetical protein
VEILRDNNGNSKGFLSILGIANITAEDKISYE